VAATQFLKEYHLPAEVQVSILACPMAGIMAGVGGAIARTTVDRQVESVVNLINLVKRSAAASERARLARELHDSLTKTLRGVSFAALALPASLRRHPELAEQLATTVSAGVEEAAEQARGLVTGLRLDDPEVSFSQVIEDICHDWSHSTGIAVDLDLAPVEPAVAVRYELLRILGEALANVHRQAFADRVRVQLGQRGQSLQFVVADDGRGLPRRPRGPSDGHFGIVGMIERARAIGGSLVTKGSAQHGTEVIVTVPLRLAEQTHGASITRQTSF
jgi:signal transduction histidine kinase